ncbi:MAG TPA: hypothetical protein PK677_13795 [Acidiphilium sp.]|uniref:hypothetical protein n=1 Tax=unclassified Acidiphilium TaxID=2617493 RepID=UPI000BD8225F|nr:MULTISPECIES: hypothetical protein [unclassified Acidiphilium]OYV89003.1 MAG: hypothetical protein B7Z57_14010 [Acidiphilium sp. 37-60-79]OZB22102.1 MAG: hypothetical protein B7X49_17300 [Acidiphilium sp. 34-64-41]HQT89600.1 hypothetical protein [Acidiphilium sp.]
MLDRKMQNNILRKLKDAYPRTLLIFELIEGDEGVKYTNLAYLKELGLITGGMQASGNSLGYTHSAITARGLDFLEDDGGLSAILGTVTVKLHSDTIRDLISAKIEASTLPATEKDQIKARLKSLPATALQAATLDLLRMGLERAPDAVQMIQRLCGF